ncbi:MAG: GNAT family N-acetyltransferase [bacterium]
MGVTSAAARLIERAYELERRRAGITLERFSSWTPEVSAFYRQLDGASWIPEALMRDLVMNQQTHKKMVMTVSRHGEPWALVPLRLLGLSWQPLICGVANAYDNVLCSGDRGDVLGSLGLNIGVVQSWTEPVGWKNVQWKLGQTNYGLPLNESPELFWRKTERWKTVIQARRRSANFELVRDDLDSALWINEKWHERWSRGDISTVVETWQDRETFIRWGLETGAVRCWALRDGRRWIGGVTGIVKAGGLDFATVYRDREYDWYGIGNLLFAETMLWAHSAGLQRATLGAAFEYKRWWAQPDGKHWKFSVCPLPLHALNWAHDRSMELRARFD